MQSCNEVQCDVNITVAGAVEPLFFQWNDDFTTYSSFRNNVSLSLINSGRVLIIDANDCRVTVSLFGMQ